MKTTQLNKGHLCFLPMAEELVKCTGTCTQCIREKMKLKKVKDL